MSDIDITGTPSMPTKEEWDELERRIRAWEKWQLEQAARMAKETERPNGEDMPTSKEG